MLLFLALMIVYIVWYQVRWNELKTITETQNSWSGIQILTKSGDLIPTISAIVDIQDDVWFTTTTGNVSIVKTGTTTINKTWVTVSVPNTTTGTMNKNTTIKLLSGTSIYYWSIAVIEKLWIK